MAAPRKTDGADLAPVTITDVARKAEVSPATVSRVLNGSSPVSPVLAQRVEAAAAKLGYRPFGPARALRQQRTRVWAAIVADIENPFFTAVVRGIEDAAQREDHRLVLCNSDEDVVKEAAYVDVAIAERMAGVVIAVASTAGSTLDELLDRQIPVVAIDRRPDRHDVDSVVIDNRFGGDQATDHLLGAGAERIACITGPTHLSTAVERLEGYRDALRRHGRRFDRALVRRADFKEQGGYSAAVSLVSSRQPPDALFVANNLMTLGALRAVREAGLRVPDDVLLVGFDDAPWTTMTSPQLTVVAQPTHEIGRVAAQLLASSGQASAPRHVILSPSLVVRESSVRR
jgi:LacI family transcriptional regulator